MPVTVVQPGVHTLPDNTADYQALGQGGGLLLAALLNYYRHRGPGTYTSPTGETFPAQSVKNRPPSPLGFSFQPSRLPFLGPSAEPGMEKRLQQAQAGLIPLQYQQAQAEVAKAPFELSKLKAETGQLEAGAALMKRFSGAGGIGEGGLPGVIVATDDAGKPVSPDDPTATRKFLLQPSGAGGMPKMTQLTETAEERADVKQRATAENLLNDTKLIMEDIDTLFNYLDDVPSGRLEGIGVKAETVFGTDSPAALGLRNYESEKDLFLAKISKVLGGEVGVLTDQDIKRIAAAFPKYWMTAKERANRITQVKSYIQRRVDAFTVRSGKTGLSGSSFPSSRSSGDDPLGIR